MADTQTVTVVFTDLVDSTATAERLGPEAADEHRQTHFRLLRGAVTGSGGNEVKNLGDGLMVTYSSPSRALAGAVGMQQAIEHHNRSGAEPMSVRIGVSSGEATVEDGDFFGDPVVEAARLCAAASGGQILAADVVRALVGRHATQTSRETGPMELKGISTPIDVVEVLWEPLVVAGSIPLPGRLVAAATEALFGFFGRAAELAALNEIRKQAHTSGRPQVVFVAGEAGMGKTSLVAQFARTAHREGSVVLLGHSDEDLGVAYQPWIEALTTLVRQGDPELVAGLRPAQSAALARLVPDVADEGVRVADQDTERLLLLEAVCELVAAASKSSPVLLVLDDLHWADNASLQLLRHVISSATAMDLTVACTYRDSDLGRGDPLTKVLADIHREANVTRIALSGLEDVEIVELMTAAAGHELDTSGVGLAHALRRDTDGNPFFTAELLRHLAETGEIMVGDDGRWKVAEDLEELGLPTSVRDVVGRRVERLGEEASRILSLAAVIGREFDFGLLTSVAHIDEDHLLDLMDAAVSAAILVADDTAGRYRFAHALIQHSLYGELSPTRRQRAHQHIAEALESGESVGEDAATLADLARHWIAATRPTDLDKAIDYARRAGDAAREALAPDDAIGWYRQALDLMERQPEPDEHRRAYLLADLGVLEYQTGQPDYESTLLRSSDIALRLETFDVLVKAALSSNPVNLGSWGNPAARPVIHAAIDRCEDQATPTKARLFAELAFTYDGGIEAVQRRDFSLEALAVARLAQDETTFVQVITATYYSLGVPDQLDQMVEDIETAVAIADRSADPDLQFHTRQPMMWAAYQRADIAKADAVLAEMEAIGNKLGLLIYRAFLVRYAIGRALLAGRADDAEASNELWLELGTAAGYPDALSGYGGFLRGIRQHQGRVDEIVDLFLAAARDNPSIPALRSAVPAILCQVDRLDEARPLLADEASNGFDYPYDVTWPAAMANATDAAATLREIDACDTLVKRLAPFANQVLVPSGMTLNGALARPLARAATVQGDYDQAESWFNIAHGIHQRLQAPYWTARGQLDHADLCLARNNDGDRERARNLAMTAASTATDYGCAGLTKRAEALLADQ